MGKDCNRKWRSGSQSVTSYYQSLCLRTWVPDHCRATTGSIPCSNITVVSGQTRHGCPRMAVSTGRVQPFEVDGSSAIGHMLPKSSIAAYTTSSLSVSWSVRRKSGSSPRTPELLGCVSLFSSSRSISSEKECRQLQPRVLELHRPLPPDGEKPALHPT